FRVSAADGDVDTAAGNVLRKLLLHFRHPSFSGTAGVWAPAGKCSCISGVLRFRGRKAFGHPPENAPAFPASFVFWDSKRLGTRRKMLLHFRHPSFSGTAGV